MRKSNVTKSIHGFPNEILLNIDGNGANNINTGIGMFDHLLELFSKHGNFNLDITCKGDLHVDDHHTVDEIGMNLGLAFKEAIQSNYSINRYGFFILPMDETLTTCAVDFCGRSSFIFDVEFKGEKLGSLSTEMIREFWNMFSQKAQINFIVKSEYGTNDHHIAEGLFKCIAKSINIALTEKIN